MNILNINLRKIIQEYINYKLPIVDELKSKTKLIKTPLEDDRFYYSNHFITRSYNHDRLSYKCKISFSKLFNYHINHMKI